MKINNFKFLFFLFPSLVAVDFPRYYKAMVSVSAVVSIATPKLF